MIPCAEDGDRSAKSIKHRFRKFVVPAIESRGQVAGGTMSAIRDLRSGVAAVTEALDKLTAKLGGADR